MKQRNEYYSFSTHVTGQIKCNEDIVQKLLQLHLLNRRLTIKLFIRRGPACAIKGGWPGQEPYLSIFVRYEVGNTLE